MISEYYNYHYYHTYRDHTVNTIFGTRTRASRAQQLLHVHYAHRMLALAEYLFVRETILPIGYQMRL